MNSSRSSKLIASLLSAVITLLMLIYPAITVQAASGSSSLGSSGTISYQFSGTGKNHAGYAEGTITLSVKAKGKYKLYWANSTRALSGYYPIGSYSLNAGESKSVKLGYHTVIPKDATRIIATTGSLNVSDAYAVYTIPTSNIFISAGLTAS